VLVAELLKRRQSQRMFTNKQLYITWKKRNISIVNPLAKVIALNLENVPHTLAEMLQCLLTFLTYLLFSYVFCSCLWLYVCSELKSICRLPVCTVLTHCQAKLSSRFWIIILGNFSGIKGTGSIFFSVCSLACLYSCCSLTQQSATRTMQLLTCSSPLP